MSETPKRRRGDRRDAVLLRETDALHFIMAFPLRLRLTSRMLLPMLQWKRLKRERICMARLIALPI